MVEAVLARTVCKHDRKGPVLLIVTDASLFAALIEQAQIAVEAVCSETAIAIIFGVVQLRKVCDVVRLKRRFMTSARRISLLRARPVYITSTCLIASGKDRFISGAVLFLAGFVRIILTAGRVDMARCVWWDNSQPAQRIFFVIFWPLPIIFHEFEHSLGDEDSRTLSHEHPSSAQEVAHVTSVVVGHSIEIIEREYLKARGEVLRRSFPVQSWRQ